MRTAAPGLSHPSRRAARRSSGSTTAASTSDFGAGGDAAEPAALGSAADPDASRPTSSTGLVTMAGNGDADSAERDAAIHIYAANRSMTRPLLLQRRRRTADRAAAGPAAARSPSWACSKSSRRRSRSCRAACASGSSCRDGDGARLRLRELRRAVPPARPRPDRLQRPRQSARFPDARSPAYEDREGQFELVAKFMGNLWARRDRPFAARRRRLARQLRALQVRPAPLQRDRLDQLRSSRSVDLPGAAVAVRHAGRRHDRFRDLPAALAGRWSTRSARRGSTATWRASSWA